MLPSKKTSISISLLFLSSKWTLSRSRPSSKSLLRLCSLDCESVDTRGRVLRASITGFLTPVGRCLVLLSSFSVLPSGSRSRSSPPGPCRRRFDGNQLPGLDKGSRMQDSRGMGHQLDSGRGWTAATRHSNLAPLSPGVPGLQPGWGGERWGSEEAGAQGGATRDRDKCTRANHTGGDQTFASQCSQVPSSPKSSQTTCARQSAVACFSSTSIESAVFPLRGALSGLACDCCRCQRLPAAFLRFVCLSPALPLRPCLSLLGASSTASSLTNARNANQSPTQPYPSTVARRWPGWCKATVGCSDK